MAVLECSFYWFREYGWSELDHLIKMDRNRNQALSLVIRVLLEGGR
jgi:hypothetical protein